MSGTPIEGMPHRQQRWLHALEKAHERATSVKTLTATGRLIRMVGLTLEAVGVDMPVGGRCEIVSGSDRTEAEVVGFDGNRTFLMPRGDIRGMKPNAQVFPIGTSHRMPVGKEMLGRVLDGAGEPLDGKGPLSLSDQIDILGTSINPLMRAQIREPLDVGIRAINGLLSIGRGQRMGLFAGSGVGKSVLLGMMARYTSADIIVVGLIGERGREVNEFVQNNLGEAGLKRSVVVVSPADAPPLMRLHGAWYATAIAEHFRNQGLQVLLLIDSLTRFAQAQREIALAIGEPPATKGYTPSVFSRLPQLVERAGNGAQDSGSITAFYTVLTEGDDQNDPIADAARAILDGHIVLSRSIADSGRYPAIDVEASISRVMHDVVDKAQLNAARRFKQIYSAFSQHRDLINVGAYQNGSDPRVDEAIELYPRLEHYLQQDMHQEVDYTTSTEELAELLNAEVNHAAKAINASGNSEENSAHDLTDYLRTQALE